MSVAVQGGDGRLNGRQGLRGLIGIALGVTALAALPAPTLAQDVTSSIAVKRIDRHPSSDRAVRRLLDRLGRAALEVCGGSSFGLREANDSVVRSQCWRDSMADAVGRIDDPRLTGAFRRSRRRG